jgi:hypothetical protein
MTDLHKLTDEQLVRELRNAKEARDSHNVASTAAYERSQLPRGGNSMMTYPASANLASKTWHDGKIVMINNSIQRYEAELKRREEHQQLEQTHSALHDDDVDEPMNSSTSAWCKRNPEDKGCRIMGGRRRTVRSSSKAKSSRRYKKKTSRSRKHRSSNKK